MGVNHCLLNFVNSLCRKLLQVVFFMLSFFTLVSLIAFYGWGLHPLFCQAPFNIYYFFFLLKNAPFALLMQKVVILRTGVVFANRMACQLIIFMSSVWGWCIIFGLKCSFCLQCYCCVSFNKKFSIVLEQQFCGKQKKKVRTTVLQCIFAHNQKKGIKESFVLKFEDVFFKLHVCVAYGLPK